VTDTHLQQPDEEAPEDGTPEQVPYHLLGFAEHHTPAQPQQKWLPLHSYLHGALTVQSP